MRLSSDSQRPRSPAEFGGTILSSEGRASSEVGLSVLARPSLVCWFVIYTDSSHALTAPDPLFSSFTSNQKYSFDIIETTPSPDRDWELNRLSIAPLSERHDASLATALRKLPGATERLGNWINCDTRSKFTRSNLGSRSARI